MRVDGICGRRFTLLHRHDLPAIGIRGQKPLVVWGAVERDDGYCRRQVYLCESDVCGFKMAMGFAAFVAVGHEVMMVRRVGACGAYPSDARERLRRCLTMDYERIVKAGVKCRIAVDGEEKVDHRCGFALPDLVPILANRWPRAGVIDSLSWTIETSSTCGASGEPAFL